MIECGFKGNPIPRACDRNGGGDDVIHITGSEWPVLGENSGDNDNGDDEDDDGDDVMMIVMVAVIQVMVMVMMVTM